MKRYIYSISTYTEAGQQRIHLKVCDERLLPADEPQKVELFNNCEKVISFFREVELDSEEFCAWYKLYREIVRENNMSLEFEKDGQIYLI